MANTTLSVLPHITPDDALLVYTHPSLYRSNTFRSRGIRDRPKLCYLGSSHLNLAATTYLFNRGVGKDVIQLSVSRNSA